MYIVISFIVIHVKLNIVGIFDTIKISFICHESVYIFFVQ